MNDQPHNTFNDLCLKAEADLKSSHDSLLKLWHLSCDHPHPFAGLLIEPLVNDIARINQKVAQLRIIEESIH